MATERQREAARRNVKKAQAAWQAMSHEDHARAQPQGRGRKKPGAGGEGRIPQGRERAVVLGQRSRLEHAPLDTGARRGFRDARQR